MTDRNMGITLADSQPQRPHHMMLYINAVAERGHILTARE